VWYNEFIKGKELITMLKNGTVICPTCGGEVVAFDSVDIEVESSRVILCMVGECDHCGNHYQWHENYTYAGYFNLEQTHDESEDEEDEE
jgi:C4-type Zn-finger protein